jgi:hypothetical protein
MNDNSNLVTFPEFLRLARENGGFEYNENIAELLSILVQRGRLEDAYDLMEVIKKCPP